jgi:hypothetical protein
MPRQQAGTRARQGGKRTPNKVVRNDDVDTAFVDALSLDFLMHGASAIAKVREDDPVTYMKLCAQVLPKSLIKDLHPFESLSDEELREHALQLAKKAGFRLHRDADGA